MPGCMGVILCYCIVVNYSRVTLLRTCEWTYVSADFHQRVLGLPDIPQQIKWADIHRHVKIVSKRFERI